MKGPQREIIACLFHSGPGCPGGAEPSRAERSGGRLSARGAPASLRLRLRPAERPPHRGSRSAGRRHPPAAARHCTAACDFRCSTLPGRSLGGGFFSRPPGAPPRLPPFPQGRFLGALPPPQRSGARAGRAGGREVFPEISSPRCPVTGKGRMMRALAPAVAVQMQISETLPLQSPRNRKKENLLPPSRRKTPNSLAKRLLSYPLVLKEFRRS